MSEKIVAPEARNVDEILEEVERELSLQGVPTLLRLRAAMLTREVFNAVCGLGNPAGMFRCSFPSRGMVMFQFRDKAGALKPDLKMVQRLSVNPCTQGVKVGFQEGRCALKIDPAQV